MKKYNSKGSALLFFIGLVMLVSMSVTSLKGQKISTDHPGYVEKVKEKYRDEIIRLLKKYKVTGVSIALVDDQQIVWAEGFGFEDKERLIKASELTTYRIGSISKLFTAIAVMQLFEKGVIHIDSAYVKYVPEFHIKTRFSSAPEITPRMLMSHHAGIPGDIFKGLITQQAETYSSIIDILHDQYMAYPPNTIFAYSNLSASLSGFLVEKTTHLPFETYMMDSVFIPLGMTHSDFGNSPAVREHLSEGYNQEKKYEDTDIREVPAGLMKSNVNDLSKFISMIFASGYCAEKAFLSTASLDEMSTQQNKDMPLDLDFKIGLGWFLSSNGLEYAGKYAGHGGDTETFHSSISVLPDHKLGVVVLTNSISGIYIRDKIATDLLKYSLEYKEGILPPENEKEKISKDIPAYAFEIPGEYATIQGLISISRKEDRIFARNGRLKMQLFWNSDSCFTPRGRLLGIIPVTLNDQKIVFRNIEGQKILFFNGFAFGEEITLQELKPCWKNRIGKYELLNRGNDKSYFSDSKLILDHGFLTFTTDFFGQRLYLILRPENDQEAVTMGLGRSMHETVVFENLPNGDEILKISGYELRRFEF